MSRCLLCLILVGLVGAAAGAPEEQRPAEEKPAGVEQAPPEEDENLTAKQQYSFNPLQAAKELQVGKFYFKKGNLRAAAMRFEEATRWDGNLAEAYLRLGEVREKQKDMRAAREAYVKYLELSPDAKNAGDIRKKLGKKKGK
jgi:tetratricopeptide (TPR) repeat protein